MTLNCRDDETTKSYIVDLQCQTHAGNPVGRRYQVDARNEDSAFDLSLELVQGDDRIAKVHGGDITEVHHD